MIATGDGDNIGAWKVVRCANKTNLKTDTHSPSRQLLIHLLFITWPSLSVDLTSPLHHCLAHSSLKRYRHQTSTWRYQWSHRYPTEIVLLYAAIPAVEGLMWDRCYTIWIPQEDCVAAILKGIGVPLQEQLKRPPDHVTVLSSSLSISATILLLLERAHLLLGNIDEVVSFPCQDLCQEGTALQECTMGYIQYCQVFLCLERSNRREKFVQSAIFHSIKGHKPYDKALLRYPLLGTHFFWCHFFWHCPKCIFQTPTVISAELREVLIWRPKSLSKMCKWQSRVGCWTRKTTESFLRQRGTGVPVFVLVSQTQTVLCFCLPIKTILLLSPLKQQ